MRAAQARLAGQIANTPCVQSRTLSEITGAELWLKFENLQYTASFKERGALQQAGSAQTEQAAAGVIAMSAGNHAQGVAYHARRLGMPATIVMPRVDAIREGREHAAASAPRWCSRARASTTRRGMRCAARRGRRG